MPVPLILASSSPRRRALLAEYGYDFVVRPAEVLEISPVYLSAGEIVLRNARTKAVAVARDFPEGLVLGVDTVVEFEGAVLGKPQDFAEAAAMLGRLNGCRHAVYSGVWLAQGGQSRGFVEITFVHFHNRSEVRRAAYHARIGPLDKAGAYAAQDDRGEMIRSVEGSFTNVVGLPMERLAKVLEEFV